MAAGRPEVVAILGAGGMGTALAILAHRAGAEVRLLGRDPEHVAAICDSRENVRHLPGIELPPAIAVTADPLEALDGASLIFAAIPSAYLRGSCLAIARDGAVPASVPVVSVVKGIERETFRRPTEILLETLDERPVAVLSGPSHAEEFARGLPASVVVASSDEGLGRRTRDLLLSETFRPYLNTDLVGVELAGALKNVLGIAAGICEGLGFGDNAKAALLTRGLVEMARFAADLGAQPATFWGLAGVGDVLTTCYSPFGRNRAVGLEIGRGRSIEAIQAESTNVAEGVFTAQSVVALARSRGIAMPIAEEVYAILFERKPPRAAVADLMLRDPKFE
jgi:glycerol-3-phosphate dehydrogenase (NAD(P)+)